MAKRKKSYIDSIPLVPVPADMWEEMLERGGGDPKLAKWIWSCWMFNDGPEAPNPLVKK